MASDLVTRELSREAPPARAVVVFWDRTELPEPVVDLSVYGTDEDGERERVEVNLVRGAALLDWLRDRPEPPARPSVGERLRAVVRRVSPARAGASERTGERLERAFPPR